MTPQTRAPRPWRQVSIPFDHPDDQTGVERLAAAHLRPVFEAAHTEELITGWFMIRKTPCWRLRYQPTDDSGDARTAISRQLTELHRAGLLGTAAPTEVVYEPEVTAFGGATAMTLAHRLFCHDSRLLLAHLAAHPHSTRRVELSILLISAMLRGAGLDWFEQGDAWACVADLRGAPPTPPDRLRRLAAPLRRLMMVDSRRLSQPGGSLAEHAAWFDGFTAAGRDLAELNRAGSLHRGLRGVLAHHILFTWNRHSLPYEVQVDVAGTATAVIFDDDLAIELLAGTRTAPAHNSIHSSVQRAR
jgi:thiopeptide-type bacteriocin biosynthesis protein